MFKPKHVFTCPDVIYLQDRQKKLNRYTIAINLLLMGGFLAIGYIAEAKSDAEFQKLMDEIPDPE